MTPSTQLTRHLNWNDCYNVRDLGGYETATKTQTRWQAVVRADNLYRLTPSGREALLDYGIRTVIDLRSGDELSNTPNPFADNFPPVAYFNLPLLDEADHEGLKALSATDTLRENYCYLLTRFPAQVAAIMQAIAEAQPGGVLIHCFAGKDRTGLMSALLLSIAGVPGETIAADYALTDLYLQPLYAEIRAKAEGDPLKHERLKHWLVSPPETMLAVLSHLEHHYGGPQAYLRSAGVTQMEIDRIRERLCD